MRRTVTSTTKAGRILIFCFGFFWGKKIDLLQRIPQYTGGKYLAQTGWDPFMWSLNLLKDDKKKIFRSAIIFWNPINTCNHIVPQFSEIVSRCRHLLFKLEMLH
eukprot:PhF_6_TR35936/c0_g1_i1/m.52078